MKKIIYITDYIEGIPKIASVRYEEIIKLLNKRYDITVVYDKDINSEDSKYINNNIKFKSNRKNNINTSKDRNNTSNKSLLINKIKNLIKDTNMYKKMNSKKYDIEYFNRNNNEFYENIIRYISCNNIDVIFITIPSINGLYIAKRIKENYPNIKIITEVRDIINNNIEKAIDKKVLIKAEQYLGQVSDFIICLSEGIYNHYNSLYPNIPCKIIKNGFSDEMFSKCVYQQIKDKEKIIFSHIGSIYGGRNIKDFILGLDIYSKLSGKICELNLIGNMDSIAITDIAKAKANINNNMVKINDLGVVNHEVAIEYLKNTDVSVILTHKEGSNYAIPGKVFEHIGACKPTIAVTEDKGLIELIDGKYGQCASHNINEISKQIDILINADYSFNDKKRFSREEQVRKIATIIDK